MSDNAIPLGDANDMLDQAIRGLDWWCETQTAPVSKGISLPVYGLNQFRKSIYNAAAYSLGALQLVKENTAHKKSLQFVMDEAVDSFGWVYAADNNIIDLLHQWYIINPLIDAFGVTAVSKNALGVIGQFSTPDGYIDTMMTRASCYFTGHYLIKHWL